jgi:hypothetical protein
MSRGLHWLRKALLLANAVTFLGFAVSTLVAPTWTATLYGYALIGAGGSNEFHAVYLGMWLGLTAGFVRALRRYQLAAVGDTMFTLILLQGLGRAYSFAVDGIPPTRFVLFFAAEFLSAIVGLAIRPHAAGETS